MEDEFPGCTTNSDQLPNLRTDIRKAGGTWVDEQVKVCEAQDCTLVTSRKPDDFEAFCSAAVEAFATATMRVG